MKYYRERLGGINPCIFTYLSLGATALGEPWSPLQPVSTTNGPTHGDLRLVVRFLNKILFTG
jgi:hypothetical protein